ncbi:hypothetical protein IL306_005325 [Fusarium sp. DS 682]|nr:hypothetical protein IL306_005325 [Fusarium sp. DS 682]
MKLIAFTLFLLGIANGSVIRTPAANTEAVTTVNNAISTPATTPVATGHDFVAQGEKPAKCGITCAFWYQKCYFRPWAYDCDDNGRFIRRGWNPDCEKNCWCTCDSK